MLDQLAAAITAAGTVNGFRQGLAGTASNLRQQAADWRAEIAGKRAAGPVDYVRLLAQRAEVDRWASKLEQIAASLEAEAKKRERDEQTHQRAAEALMAQAKAGAASTRAPYERAGSTTRKKPCANCGGRRKAASKRKARR